MAANLELQSARAASAAAHANLSSTNKPRSSKTKTCCGLTVRALVSKKKLRFVENGVDLDLSYITDRCVAMGWPSMGLEALYRNPATEVRNFLESRHGGHYRIWNLCIERGYGAASLGLNCEVERYSWYDHTPPPLQLMRPCLASMQSWLDKDKENIVVVHCKAGKGRTGTIIAALLVHAGACATADEALELFGWRRTRNGKGVTIPSQMRFVRYSAAQVAATKVAALYRTKICSSIEDVSMPSTYAGRASIEQKARVTESSIAVAANTPALARITSTAADLDEPTATVLTVQLQRDALRRVGFMIAADLESKPVIASFTSYGAASDGKEAASDALRPVLAALSLGDEIRSIEGEAISGLPIETVISMLRNASDPVQLTVFRRPDNGLPRQVPPSTVAEYCERIAGGIGPWAVGSDPRLVPSPSVHVQSIALSHLPTVKKSGACRSCMACICDLDEHHTFVDAEEVKQQLYVQIYGGEHCRTLVFDSRHVHSSAVGVPKTDSGAGHAPDVAAAAAAASTAAASVPDWGSPSKSTRNVVPASPAPTTNAVSPVPISGSKRTLPRSRFSAEETGSPAPASTVAPVVGAVPAPVRSSGTAASTRVAADLLRSTPLASLVPNLSPATSRAGSTAASSTGHGKDDAASTASAGSASPVPLSFYPTSASRSKQQPHSNHHAGVRSPEPDSDDDSDDGYFDACGGHEDDCTGGHDNASDDEGARAGDGHETPGAAQIEASPSANAPQAQWDLRYFDQSSSQQVTPSDGSSGPARVTCAGDFRIVIKLKGKKKPIAAAWMHSSFLPLPTALQSAIGEQVSMAQNPDVAAKIRAAQAAQAAATDDDSEASMGSEVDDQDDRAGTTRAGLDATEGLATPKPVLLSKIAGHRADGQAGDGECAGGGGGEALPTASSPLSPGDRENTSASIVLSIGSPGNSATPTDSGNGTVVNAGSAVTPQKKIAVGADDRVAGASDAPQASSAAAHVLPSLPPPVFVTGDFSGGKVEAGCPTLGAIFTAAGSIAAASTGATSTASSATNAVAASSRSMQIQPELARACVGTIVLSKNQIDGMIKDKKGKTWPSDITLSVSYRLDPFTLPQMFKSAVSGAGSS